MNEKPIFRLEKASGYTIITVAGQTLGSFDEGENSIIARKYIAEQGSALQRFRNKREAIDWVLEPLS